MKLNYLISVIFFVNTIIFADKSDEVKKQLADLNNKLHINIIVFKKRCNENDENACFMLEIINLIKKFTDTDPNANSIYNLINFSTQLPTDINNSKINFDSFLDKINELISYFSTSKTEKSLKFINFLKDYLNNKLNEIRELYKAYCKKNICYAIDGQKIQQEILICKRN